MNWLKTIWRWFTVADAPRIHPVHGYCDFCAEPTQVLVSINDQEWNTCVTHMSEPRRLFVKDDDTES